MNFGQALELCKSGALICRSGWNGKDMFVGMQKGYPEGVPANRQTADLLRIPEGEPVKVRPYLVLRGADKMLATWVPSSTDVLADDWQTFVG